MKQTKPQRAILITGFGSWGKSRHIKDLFGVQRFAPRPFRPLDATINAEFLVESRSNDDVGHARFIRHVEERYIKAGSSCRKTDLLAAFCPAREDSNDSMEVLSSPVFKRFQEVHVVLLQYKWDWHAELRLVEVKKYLRADRRVVFHLINHDAAFKKDHDRLAARDDAIRAYLRKLYL
jgi:hypothetical protein